MRKTAKSTADEKFTATQKKATQVLKEREKAAQERVEHVVKLRTLRLAKEAADKEAAAKASAEKAAAKKKKKPARAS